MEQLSQFFKNLGTGRLVLFAGVGILTFFFFSVILTRMQSSPMEILFADLEPADSNEIVQRLAAQNVQYEIGAGGRSISVPEDKVSELRLQFAGEGLTGGVIGKEIFDQEASFGRTNFELNVNYVRAIEGELSRTITALRNVNEARVHVVMPERRPFQRELSEPTASVLLKTRSSGLTGEQVRSIQALVASAVSGMSADRVTITDTNGRLLSDGTRSGAIGSFSSMDEARMAMEQQLRSKIEGLLGRSLGAENIRADVAVQLDTSRTTQNEIIFDPNNQVASAVRTIENTSTERDANGQVTVGNNLPDADEDAAGNVGGSSSSGTEETTEFENSKREVVTVTEPGAIKSLRVAVMINEIKNTDADGNVTYTARDQGQIDALTDLVKSAVPFDAERDGDDAIQVRSMRFADPPELEPTEPEFDFLGLNKNDLVELIQMSALGISGILFLLLVVRPIVTRVVEAIPDAPPPVDPNAPQQIEDQTPDLPALTGPDGEITITPELIQRAAEGDAQAQMLVSAAKTTGSLSTENMAADMRISVAQIEGKIQDTALQRVSDIISSNPEESVAIVRSWMYSE